MVNHLRKKSQVIVVILLLMILCDLSVRPQQTENDRVVKPNDVVALLAFSLIRKDLPQGTRPSSSFRTSKDQLRIIRHFAEIEGIPTHSMSLDNPKSWEPVLATLRSRNYYIAAPGQSPHEDENKIVIDLTGANLSEIEKGCLKSESRGIIHIYNKILERKNNAFHVEFGLKSTVLSFLGLDPQLVKSDEDDQTLKRNIVNEIREKAKLETDPGKRADRLRSLQETQGLVEYGDPYYLALKNEIEQYERDDKELVAQQQKREILVAISNARESRNWEIAKKKAQEFNSTYPNERTNLVSMIEAEQKYLEAVKKTLETDPPMQCEECGEALDLAKETVSLLENAKPTLPSNVEKKFLGVIESRVNRCRSQFILRVVLWTLASIALLFGLFFAFRPGKLILFCEDGDQHGESFALDQSEIIIGSLGEPDGEAQIVVNDRKRKISRSHCKIIQKGRRFYLKDLNSANGTVVNGLKLEDGQYHELRKGDEISLAGAAILIVRRR